MNEHIILNDVVLIVLIYVISALIVIWGRIEYAIGIYSAILYWAYNVQILSTNLLWLLFGTLIGASISFYIKNKLKGRSKKLLAHRDVALILFMAIWGLWMLFLYLTFPSPFAEMLIKNIYLYNILTFLLVILFIRNMKQVAGFVRAFMVTSIGSGIIAIQLLSTPLRYLGEDPYFRLRGLSGTNYLTFAIPFALTAIFGLTQMLATRNSLRFVMLGGAVLSAIGLLALTGSRQSVIGVSLALVMIIIVFARANRFSRLRNILIILAIVLTGVGIISTTRLRERWTNINVDVQTRLSYWKAGLFAFSKSPIYGNGFDYIKDETDTAHNLLLDTMASQGLVGVAFLVGFIGLTIRSIPRLKTLVNDTYHAPLYTALICALVYTLIQTGFSGGLASAPHFFWICALIWRLNGLKAQKEKTRDLVVAAEIGATNMQKAQA